MRAMLLEYSALGAEKRLQQWTLRFLHLGQFGVAAGLVWGIYVLGLGPWLGEGRQPNLRIEIVAVVGASTLLLGVLNLFMAGAVFQAFTISKMQAKLEESVNEAVGAPAMTWEHLEVPGLYQTNMGKANYLYRADRVLFPLLIFLQLVGTLVAGGYLQVAHGWGFAGVAVALSLIVIVQSVVMGIQLLNLVRRTGHLEDLRQR